MLIFLFFLEINSFIDTLTTDFSYLHELTDLFAALLVNQNGLGEVLNRVAQASRICASLDAGEPAERIHDERAVVRVEQRVDDLIDDFISLGDGELDSGGSSSVLVDGTLRPSPAQGFLVSVEHLDEDHRLLV